MSFSTDLTGIRAAQSDIDTISNNIANISTTGFKGSVAHFGDIYANAVAGAAGNSTTPGLGVNTTSLAQQFAQGALQQTGNPLNLAINGNGFFQIQSAFGTAYTRDGTFHLDSRGNLVTDDGSAVLGFAGGPNGLTGSTSGPVQPVSISTVGVPAAATANLTLGVALPSGDTPIDTTAKPFSLTDPTSYNESTTTTVFDSLGVSRSLTTFFTQVSGSGSPNQWETHWEVTDTAGTFIASGAGPVLTFNGSGQFVSGSGSFTVNNLPNGAAALNISENFAGSTLSNLPFGVNSVTNDGHAAGEFTGIQINANGDVTGQYSNGETRVFGTIALARFVNPQGLIPTTNNNWLASVDSGQPIVGGPGNQGLGPLQSGALESSNVDLSAELVNLIAAQQAYQANVQGISVEQQNVQRLLSIQ
jgi:flagellar hook protein FlgE